MIFKFRDKKDKIGTIMGAICFTPSFLIAVAIGTIKNDIFLAMIIMAVCQILWLYSIHLCTESLELENKQLKNKLKELKLEGEK